MVLNGASCRTSACCAKTHLHAYVISKNFPGVIPRAPVKRGRKGWERESLGWKGKEQKWRERGERKNGKGRERKERMEGKGEEREGGENLDLPIFPTSFRLCAFGTSNSETTRHFGFEYAWWILI
jgi:hypothetical protein